MKISHLWGFYQKTEGQIFALLQKFAHTNLVFYESPNRLLKTLAYVEAFDKSAKVAVGRELTKMFEEIVVDEVQNVIEHYKNNVLKGELVVMVYKKEGLEFSQSEILEKIELLKKRQFSTKDISTILADLYDLNKNEVYKLTL